MRYKANISELQLCSLSSIYRFKTYSHFRWYSQRTFKNLYYLDKLPEFVNIIYKTKMVSINMNTLGTEFFPETLDNIEAWQPIREIPAPSDRQLKARAAGRIIWNYKGLERNMWQLIQLLSEYINQYGENFSVEALSLTNLTAIHAAFKQREQELRMAVQVKPVGKAVTLADIIKDVEADVQADVQPNHRSSANGN